MNAATVPTVVLCTRALSFVAAVPMGAPREFTDRVRRILTAITPEQARTLLPPRYTGFVAATHKSYEMIEKAGVAVGKIKPR